MNPQNYTQVPQGQPQPLGYGANANMRAMQANNAINMPTSVPSTNQMTQMQPGQMPASNVPGVPMMPTQQPVATPQPVAAQPVATPQQPIASANQGPDIPGLNAPQVVESPISTQATLMFSELRDSLVIMKDGSFRAVVACQSINFDLMSENEREGVEYSYQNFLNSLNFTIQILVRSQRVDIGPYIERLAEMRRNNDNMLLGVLMDDYLQFVQILAQEANIMDKSFFIVIPYYGSAELERAVENTKNFFKAMGKNKGPVVTRINRDVYNKAIEELNNRVETVVAGLYQIGIQSVRLNTKELSELFYNFNNPDTAVREPLVDFTKLATTYVKKGVKK